jgi:phage portal protein BeeE
VANLLSRILSPILRVIGAEGSVRPGPHFLPVSGGFLPAGSPINWWQMGGDIQPLGRSAVVEACVASYAQTIAMCPGDHWRKKRNGGRERVTNSALSRVLREPNGYQTISDFMLHAVRDLYTDGTAYALALRNDRFEIDELHLMRANLCRPLLTETGDVFYQLQGNEIINKALGGQYLLVPQRDVLHVKLTTAEARYPYPLVGESPMLAAAMDAATSGAISEQQLNFYLNQARPSAVLSTDLTMDRAQVEGSPARPNSRSKPCSTWLRAKPKPLATHACIKSSVLAYRASPRPRI